MSSEAVHGFIAKINSDRELSSMVTQAMATRSDLDLVALAGQRGFSFTRDEGLKVWAEIQTDGELPDVLLDAVSGGTPIACSGKQTST